MYSTSINLPDVHQSEEHPLAKWGGHEHPTPPGGDAPHRRLTTMALLSG